MLLYSIGKDSSVLLHLARKAFYPGKPPFPLLHIDTTWKFRDDDRVSRRDSAPVRPGSAAAYQPRGHAPGHQPIRPWRRLYPDHEDRRAETGADRGQIRIAIGGARRDEERSRAKERIFSVRGPGHAWDPKRQRPELWHLYNGNLAPGETLRVFPLSNWTELDVWTTSQAEEIDVVPLYFAAMRPTVSADGQLIVVDDDRMRLDPSERPRPHGAFPFARLLPAVRRRGVRG